MSSILFYEDDSFEPHFEPVYLTLKQDEAQDIEELKKRWPKLEIVVETV